MAAERDLVVFPGDGVGPEITNEAVRVLDTVRKITGAGFRYHLSNIGDGVKKETGEAIPAAAVELFERYGLAIKGPMGESVGDLVTRLRVKFDLYANIRPVRSCQRISPPALRGDIDLVVVRENLEDIYVAKETQTSPGVRRLEGVFTKRECDRIARFSFELAKSRRGRLAIAHKSNILPKTHGLFLEAFLEIADEYPDVKVEPYYADALSAHLVRRPQEFDVVACPNLIGDILSDLAAEVGGGLGLAGSANLNPERETGLFEPVHGSAPDIAGKNVADPISQIRSGALLMGFVSRTGGTEYAKGARLIEEGVLNYLQNAPAKDLPIHLGGEARTGEVTDGIIAEIQRLARGPNR